MTPEKVKLTACDPPPAIEACLNCKRAKCNNCFGPGGMRYQEFSNRKYANKRRKRPVTG